MMARLGDICYKITDGSHNPPSGVPISEFLMLSSKNIHDGFITYDDPRYLSRENFEIENKRTQINPGDILMTIVGTVGRVTVVPENTNNICLQRSVAVIKPKKEIVLPRFLMYQIQSMKNVLEKEAKGVAQKGIYLKQVENLSIKVFERNVQESIVLHMDKICNLIELRNQQLSKLDELVKARFVEMFGDPVNNSKGLPEFTLPELGEFGRGVSKHRPRNDPKLLGGKYPLIQTGEVANSNLYITEYESTYSELGFKQSKLWQKGTLCITIAANIAKTAILTFDACFPDSVVGFKANDRTNNIFIHYWFTFFQTILEAQAPESAQKNINLKTLSELKIIVPPIEQQNEFATFVKQIDKSKLEIQQSLEKLETLKKSLMQQYFG